MNPLTLTPAETREAIDTGKVTLARVIDPQPDEDGLALSKWWDYWFDTSERAYHCPHGKVGDEFWVQEDYETKSWVELRGHCNSLLYKSNIKKEDLWRYQWQPASTMPQWASRLTLRNTGATVKLEDGKWMFLTTMEVVK